MQALDDALSVVLSERPVGQFFCYSAELCFLATQEATHSFEVVLLLSLEKGLHRPVQLLPVRIEVHVDFLFNFVALNGVV